MIIIIKMYVTALPLGPLRFLLEHRGTRLSAILENISILENIFTF